MMNDTDLLEAVSRRFDHVHLSRPAGEVAARGQAIRRRRLVPAVAAGAAAAGTALAVALTSAAAPPPQRVTLTAWTVTAEPHGTVKVTISQLFHPGRLQHALRRAGVPAVVKVGPATACRPPARLYSRILQTPRPSVYPQRGHLYRIRAFTHAVFLIHRAAVPAGVRIGFIFTPGPGGPDSEVLRVVLLTSSGGCVTGPHRQAPDMVILASP